MNNEPAQILAKTTQGGLHGHVYIIDDNADIGRHLSNVLTRYGLSVAHYTDAESFLDESVEVAPAAVLLDMALPGMNGLATHQCLIESGRKSPVIYMSGQSEPQEIIDALKKGGADFLWKPFSIDTLIAALEKALAADELRISTQVVLRQVDQYWALLTSREKVIAQLAVRGFGNNEISRQLDLKPDTVKKHRARVMEKMHVESLAELIDKVAMLTLA